MVKHSKMLICNVLITEKAAVGPYHSNYADFLTKGASVKRVHCQKHLSGRKYW